MNDIKNLVDEFNDLLATKDSWCIYKPLSYSKIAGNNHVILAKWSGSFYINDIEFLQLKIEKKELFRFNLIKMFNEMKEEIDKVLKKLNA